MTVEPRARLEADGHFVQTADVEVSPTGLTGRRLWCSVWRVCSVREVKRKRSLDLVGSGDEWWSELDR